MYMYIIFMYVHVYSLYIHVHEYCYDHYPTMCCVTMVCVYTSELPQIIQFVYYTLYTMAITRTCYVTKGCVCT